MAASIPPELPRKSRNSPRYFGQELTADIVYTFGEQYLVVVEAMTSHPMMVLLTNGKSGLHVGSALGSLISKYRAKGHIVSRLVTDHEAVFWCRMVTDLVNVLGNDFQQEVPGEHQSTAEHLMKLFREVFRMEYLALPIHLPQADAPVPRVLGM
jgi:hypothetical protein